MLTVFNDAKRGTLSAFSWSSREIAFLKGAEYERAGNVVHEKFEFKRKDLQCLFPDHHNDLLNCIVVVDKPDIKTRILNGSVDRTQKHNIHVMLNIIDDEGDTRHLFVFPWVFRTKR